MTGLPHGTLLERYSGKPEPFLKWPELYVEIMEVSAEQILVNGLGLSGLYIMVALGLTLVFSVMRILNFAHGEFYMVGAYAVWLLYAQGNLPFLAAVAVGILIVSALSIIVYLGLFRPLQGNPLGGYLGSIGIMFILQVLVGQIWGVGVNKVVPRAFSQIIHISDAYLGVHRLIVILASFALIGGVWFFLHKTKMGQALRACAQDTEAASLQGINLNKTSAIAMGISGALAGVAGALMSPVIIINPYMGGSIILKAFVVLIVGGMGSVEGAVLAGFLFGFLDSVITCVLDSTIANLLGLFVMLGVLAIRPLGLLGRETSGIT